MFGPTGGRVSPNYRRYKLSPRCRSFAGKAAKLSAIEFLGIAPLRPDAQFAIDGSSGQALGRMIRTNRGESRMAANQRITFGSG